MFWASVRAEVLPSQVQLSQPYTLPSLPSNSYLAALSLHLHRLASSLQLSAEESPQVKGLKRIVEEGLKSVAGWQGWVGKELAEWIGYDQIDNVSSLVSSVDLVRYWVTEGSLQRYRIQPEPVRPNKIGFLSDLDFLDEVSFFVIHRFTQSWYYRTNFHSLVINSWKNWKTSLKLSILSRLLKSYQRLLSSISKVYE